MFAKLQFEKNARYINSHLERQSDPNIPRLLYRSGLTALSKMSGQEIPGLCLLTIFSMGGMLGPENTDLEKDFTLLLWLGISINDSLFLPQYTETCVMTLKERINRFMSVTKTLVGPQREMPSQIGLRMAKFHGMKHYPHLIRKFGSPLNFFSGFLA